MQYGLDWGQTGFSAIYRFTLKMVPTALKSVLTTSASSSVAVLPRHMAEAVSPTKQGVLGMTRMSFALLPVASCKGSHNALRP